MRIARTITRWAVAIALAIVMFATGPVLTGSALANNCAAAARSLAASYGAQVLSVKAEGGVCVITLRIPGQGGQPPRVETHRVSG